MDSAKPRSMFSQHHKDSRRVAEQTRLIGLRLQENVGQIIDGMNQAIEDAIDELNDDHTRQQLHASVANNVEVIVDMLVRQKDADNLPAVPDAIRYAVVLAQQGVSGSALRRAYHVGSDHLLAHVFDQVQNLDAESQEQLQLFHYLAGWTYKYVDEITRAVMAAYEEYLRDSHEREARTAATYVNQVLNRQDVDPEEFRTATGYALNANHVACVMWIEDTGAASDQTGMLNDVAQHLNRHIGSSRSPLVTVIDRISTRVWFARSHREAPMNSEQVAALTDNVPGLRIAFGAPQQGAHGFCDSLAQAEQVAVIARTSTARHSRVVSYADEGMPVIALLAENIDTARQWVSSTLGALAHDTEHAALQRETLRVFLETGESYAQTAERLFMHRNSIKYRLTRAEDSLGRPSGTKRLDTHLALALCHSLGSIVLTPSKASPRR